MQDRTKDEAFEAGWRELQAPPGDAQQAPVLSFGEKMDARLSWRGIALFAAFVLGGGPFLLALIVALLFRL